MPGLPLWEWKCEMSKHKVAVIGAGAFGTNHCRVVHESERAELTAVVDIDAARSQEAAVKYGAASFTDAREVIGKVNAAIVAAPTTAHEEIGALLMDCRDRRVSGEADRPGYGWSAAVDRQSRVAADASSR